MELSGKHILITGAAKRLGRALSEAVLRRGAKLTAHYRHSASEIKSLEDWSKNQGLESVFSYQADLKDTHQLKRMVNESKNQLGTIHLLINCASDFYPTPFLNSNETDWDRLLDTNARGPYFLAQSFVAQLGNERGIIINFCDVNATKPLKNFSPYVASKSALQMLTKNMALELAPRIRVNSISPGPVLFPETFTDTQKQLHIERTLLKRAGNAADVVNGCLFLIENDYLTGFDLKVDGGQSLT